MLVLAMEFSRGRSNVAIAPSGAQTPSGALVETSAHCVGLRGHVPPENGTEVVRHRRSVPTEDESYEVCIRRKSRIASDQLGVGWTKRSSEYSLERR
jgi:hypothetical protein